MINLFSIGTKRGNTSCLQHIFLSTVLIVLMIKLLFCVNSVYSHLLMNNWLLNYCSTNCHLNLLFLISCMIFFFFLSSCKGVLASLAHRNHTQRSETTKYCAKGTEQHTQLLSYSCVLKNLNLFIHTIWLSFNNSKLSIWKWPSWTVCYVLQYHVFFFLLKISFIQAKTEQWIVWDKLARHH